ncbi:hypothetical protein VVMO6_01081 [Vibrio vulnificus MO6-24/O]|nr:hypothetical protein VVMO6_01081 [Vibrio vulnificus MO6-24/O]
MGELFIGQKQHSTIDFGGKLFEPSGAVKSAAFILAELVFILT